MFRVKICGITRRDDAGCAVEAGADAIGLNFWPESRRFVEPADAARISAELPEDVVRVGVFVDATAETIRRTAEMVGLDLVQLHGNEPPELVAALRPLAVMRAFPAAADPLAAVLAYLAECDAQSAPLRAVLLDTARDGAFGGTGKPFDWGLLGDSDRRALGVPLVLAGGLGPDNVAEAIRQVRPQAVDVASGVERELGIKDPDQVRAFIAAAQKALAELTS